MDKERVDWRLLGRTVGTGTGWDESEYLSLVIYDFIPLKGLDLPSGDVFVDMTNGTMSTVDFEQGKIGTQADLVRVLRDTVFEPVPIEQD